MPCPYTTIAINCPGVIFVTMISTITNIPANPATPIQNHWRYTLR